MRRLSLLAFILTAAAALAPAATIQLVFSATNVQPGDTFDVSVIVTDLSGADLATFGMNPYISDPAKAAFLGATVDPLLFLDFSGLLPGVSIAGLALPPIDTAPVTLSVLTFQALQSGPVMVGIMSDPNDINQGLGMATANGSFVEPLNASGQIQVDAVPEPAAAGIVLLGLSVLVLARRKAKL